MKAKKAAKARLGGPAAPGAEVARLKSRIEALEGVLRQLRTEAGKRAETTATPEKERWEWVVTATTSALEGKA